MAAPSTGAHAPLEFDLEWHLLATVPAAVRRVRRWSAARRTKEAERCADLIASNADALWVNQDAAPALRTQAVELRDALVTGLAILAQRAGGVDFVGMQWDAAIPDAAVSLLPGSWSLPRETSTGEARGAVFTPRSLADDVVANALAVLVEDRRQSGPFNPDTNRNDPDIECLRVADIACGSGALLVAAAR